jgi:hypothetical protein
VPLEGIDDFDEVGVEFESSRLKLSELTLREWKEALLPSQKSNGSF